MFTGARTRPPARFANRAAAGRELADVLAEYAGRPDVVVLGLPRGGVLVAREIAARLGAPLDVVPVRKLGVPGHPELAMGAIAAGGIRIVSDDLVRELGIPPAAIDRVAARELAELERRASAYRNARAPLQARDSTAIVVDDGLATGSTMHAAVLAVRAEQPAAIVVAVPVGAAESCDHLRRVADRVICLMTPEPFNAVGLWYDDFSETTDDEVRAALASIY